MHLGLRIEIHNEIAANTKEVLIKNSAQTYLQHYENKSTKLV